jgi:L-cysteine desulfidase
MNLLKTILKNEVFPALGCTEPTAVAYAASIAANELDGSLQEIAIRVDPGVFKNGMAVTVPNTNGERGNLIAGVLGALVRQPGQKMEVLKNVTPGMIEQAKALIAAGRASITCDSGRVGLYIDVTVRSSLGSARAVLQQNHTNLVLLEKNSTLLFAAEETEKAVRLPGYKDVLRGMTIAELVDAAEEMDEEDEQYILRGIAMNRQIAEAGQQIRKVGFYLADLKEKKFLQDDVCSSSKIMTASAADGRMGGLSLPVMSSGGSGNQGIVAILVPYNVGKWFQIDDRTIARSIALSHLINSYIKCYTGSLSPICGCAIAAGVGAAAAIVYQQKGKDMGKITLAVNNLISDLGGMLCDGAKGGCSLKVASSTDSAIRSAYMALNDHGITSVEGFVGRTAEETIRNLSRISDIGMSKVDEIMIQIMMDKNH